MNLSFFILLLVILTYCDTVLSTPYSFKAHHHERWNLSKREILTNSPSSFRMDIVAVLDSSMLSRYKNETLAKKHVTDLISSAAELFRKPILGENQIDIRLVNLIQSPLSLHELIVSTFEDGDKDFFARPFLTSHLEGIDYDVVILFTRLNLDKYDTTKGKVSSMGMACNSTQNLAVVKDVEAFKSVKIIAHDLGLLLNMTEVGSSGCEQLRQREESELKRVKGPSAELKWDWGPFSNLIMNPGIGFSDFDSLSWSICSQTALRIFLRSDKADCLRLNSGTKITTEIIQDSKITSTPVIVQDESTTTTPDMRDNAGTSRCQRQQPQLLSIILLLVVQNYY